MMDIEKIKDSYLYQFESLRKDLKNDFFLQLVPKMTNEDKKELKTSLISKIKEIISQKTNNGNLFLTESCDISSQQFSQNVLDGFRNAILNAEFKIELNIWECPESFRNIIANMSYAELNEFYNQCLNKQQELISLHSADNDKMLFDYYNRDLISNIEILSPILSYDFSYQSKRNVIGGKSFWGRKNNSLSSNDIDDILKPCCFYKNLLIAIENNIFCDTQIGFLNESPFYDNQDVESLGQFLLKNNPNICQYQNEYIVQTKIVEHMLRSNKRWLKKIVVDDKNKFEIYGNAFGSELFVLQYKTTANDFANRINNTTGSTKCEIILFYLPDKTIHSAFQLGRLDMYSENNFHKPYGKSKIETLAHIHTYSMEDAVLNNKFDKEPRETNLAHYNMFRNLPKLATSKEFELYFKKICGIEEITQRYKQFFNIDKQRVL